MSQGTLDPTAEDAERAVAALRFRRAAGRLPSSVTVITGRAPSGPLATTVATLVPASDTPPMLLFLAAETSTSARSIVESGTFAVNVLARGQEAECYRFAASGTDKFAGLDLQDSPAGLPLLDGCTFSADCTVESVVPAGDHSVVLARVTWFEASASNPVPLVFYRSRLARLDPSSGRYTPTEQLHWW